MVDKRKPQKTRYQGVAYVIWGNSYRGRKAFLVAGFVLPADQDLSLKSDAVWKMLNQDKRQISILLSC